ncbi:Transmembrane protein 59 [Collichthys lucidus]|uniref:Transmembrane protein 59 n=1 Tax=Collichthys lucidus TaxID=240159 RepID=A0A4U5UXQ3_COLLU|nr:Transmembrane protein 59 [Collichthys lucidus]
MGTLCSFLCALGLLAFSAASSDVFDTVLGNTASCHKSCEMTYSLHTYPREEELYACQRGCRLFSICQFVRDSEDLNQTKSECESTCHEAYTQTDEQYACNLGCQNQLPFAELRHEQVCNKSIDLHDEYSVLLRGAAVAQSMGTWLGNRRVAGSSHMDQTLKLEAMMPRIHLLYPLTLVRGLWEDVMNQAHSFITSTWTFYLQADDGKVVIFQTEPQVRFFSQFEVDKEVKEEPQKSFPGLSSPVYKEYHRTLIQERDRDMTGDRSYDDDYNLFSCLSRVDPHHNSGPVSHGPDLDLLCHRGNRCGSKLSIYGDKEYMKEQKLIPYPASSLLIVTSKGPEEEEAGPLPSKVNLGQSDI